MLHAKSQRTEGKHILLLVRLLFHRVSGLSTFIALVPDQKVVMEVLAIIMQAAEVAEVMQPGKQALQLIREIRLSLQLAQEAQPMPAQQKDQMLRHPARH